MVVLTCPSCGSQDLTKDVTFCDRIVCNKCFFACQVEYYTGDEIHQEVTPPKE